MRTYALEIVFALLQRQLLVIVWLLSIGLLFRTQTFFHVFFSPLSRFFIQSFIQSFILSFFLLPFSFIHSFFFIIIFIQSLFLSFPLLLSFIHNLFLFHYPFHSFTFSFFLITFYIHSFFLSYSQLIFIHSFFFFQTPATVPYSVFIFLFKIIILSSLFLSLLSLSFFSLFLFPSVFSSFNVYLSRNFHQSFKTHKADILDWSLFYFTQQTNNLGFLLITFNVNNKMLNIGSFTNLSFNEMTGIDLNKNDCVLEQSLIPFSTSFDMGVNISNSSVTNRMRQRVSFLRE